MTTSTPLISISNLSRVFKVGKERIQALEKVDLTVFSGEFVTITGPSGSGKTTLLNIIGLLDAPTNGRVLLDDFDIQGLQGNQRADFRRKHIGIIHQLHRLIPTLTVFENVILPLLPYQNEIGFDLAQRAVELLEIVGLQRCNEMYPAELSGGEQQRVAIARALINHPSIILADEPTGNLDQGTGESILQLLRENHRQMHATILMVTHNATFAQCGERRLSLVQGKLSEENHISA